MTAQTHANHSFLGRRYSAQRKIGQGGNKIARSGVWALSIRKNSVALSFELTASKAGHFLPSKQQLAFCAGS
jgi:hypothetical protein